MPKHQTEAPPQHNIQLTIEITQTLLCMRTVYNLSTLCPTFVCQPSTLCPTSLYPLSTTCSNFPMSPVYHLSTLCPPSVYYLQGKPYDGKTDVWAIGCVLYEMCALKKAFDASNLGAITVKVMRYPPLLHPSHHPYCHLSQHQCTHCLQIACAYQVYNHITQLSG